MGTAASEFYQRQLEVLERVARGEALSVVLEEIVQLIEHQSGGMLCSLLLLDAASGTVRHVAARSLMKDPRDRYQCATEAAAALDDSLF